MFNRRQGDHFAHVTGFIGDIAFNIVKQRVKPLIRRESRRHRKHQLGINDSDLRKQGEILDRRFFTCFPVGNDAAHIRFRTGSRRRRYGQDRQRFRGNGFALSRTVGNIIPNIAAVGGDDGNPLGRVKHAAAAEGDQKIGFYLHRVMAPGSNRRMQRIRFNLIKQKRLRTGLMKLFFRP